MSDQVSEKLIFVKFQILQKHQFQNHSSLLEYKSIIIRNINRCIVYI